MRNDPFANLLSPEDLARVIAAIWWHIDSRV